MKPLIVINFKNYSETMGAKALKLAAYCSAYNNVIVCPQYMELDDISNISNKVFSQHVDPILAGAHTGKVSVLALKNAGVKGSLLNHSENRIPFAQIKDTVKLLKKHNMKCIICCEALEEAKKLSKLRPDYIAFEPKKYIGKKVDITELIGDLIKEFSEVIKPVPLLIGAGIDSPREIRRALELGAVGVLLASAVTKSKDPNRVIRELANS